MLTNKIFNFFFKCMWEIYFIFLGLVHTFWDNASLNRRKGILTVHYYLNGWPYVLRVPYHNPSHEEENCMVYWLDEEGHKYEVTQQAGIPYLIRGRYLVCTPTENYETNLPFSTRHEEESYDE